MTIISTGPTLFECGGDLVARMSHGLPDGFPAAPITMLICDEPHRTHWTTGHDRASAFPVTAEFRHK